MLKGVCNVVEVSMLLLLKGFVPEWEGWSGLGRVNGLPHLREILKLVAVEFARPKTILVVVLGDTSCC